MVLVCSLFKYRDPTNARTPTRSWLNHGYSLIVSEQHLVRPACGLAASMSLTMLSVHARPALERGFEDGSLDNMELFVRRFVSYSIILLFSPSFHSLCFDCRIAVGKRTRWVSERDLPGHRSANNSSTTTTNVAISTARLLCVTSPLDFAHLRGTILNDE